MHRGKGPTTVRLAGFGGQGVVKAGEILGAAAVADGKRALQNQSYGSSARGGLCTADVIVSDGEIFEIEPETFDLLLALNQTSFDAFFPHVRPEGLVIVEQDLVRVPAAAMSPDAKPRVRSVRATHRAAQDLGRQVVMNMVALGFLAAATELLGRPALEQTIAKSVPRGTEALNLRAFGVGWDLGYLRSATTPLSPGVPG